MFSDYPNSFIYEFRFYFTLVLFKSVTLFLLEPFEPLLNECIYLIASYSLLDLGSDCWIFEFENYDLKFKALLPNGLCSLIKDYDILISLFS